MNEVEEALNVIQSAVDDIHSRCCGSPTIEFSEAASKIRKAAATVRGSLGKPVADRWLPMSDTPKDRTPLLLRLKDDIPHKGERPDLDVWDGLRFVGRHPGLADDGLDIGWSFAAPVGHGGFPDHWFVGWRHLP